MRKWEQTTSFWLDDQLITGESRLLSGTENKQRFFGFSTDLIAAEVKTSEEALFC
jgi:hypothetical protein